MFIPLRHWHSHMPNPAGVQELDPLHCPDHSPAQIIFPLAEQVQCNTKILHIGLVTLTLNNREAECWTFSFL